METHGRVTYEVINISEMAVFLPFLFQHFHNLLPPTIQVGPYCFTVGQAQSGSSGTTAFVSGSGGGSSGTRSGRR